MRNLVVASAVLLIVVPTMLYLGFLHVPGVRDANTSAFSKEFLFNGYLIFLGFFLTSAAIGPIVAQFVEWRSDAKWKAARANAVNRVGSTLRDVLEAYRTFLRALQDAAARSHAPMFLDLTIVAFDDFFDACAQEQPAFNPGMHSAASSIRQRVSPLYKSLRTTRSMTRRSQARRFYLYPEALRKIRSLLDLHPLNPAHALSSDPYLSSHGKLFIDVAADLQLGAGATTLHRFCAIDVDSILRDWGAFLAASDVGELVSVPIEGLEHDGDTQARLHAAYVRANLEEQYFVGSLIAKEAGR